MVQNLREQKLIVLPSRISTRWRVNRDIWKTMGVPYSAKYRMCISIYLKALGVMQVCQSQAQALSWNLPRWGVGRWMGCNIHHLRRNHRAINK